MVNLVQRGLFLSTLQGRIRSINHSNSGLEGKRFSNVIHLPNRMNCLRKVFMKTVTKSVSQEKSSGEIGVIYQSDRNKTVGFL